MLAFEQTKKNTRARGCSKPSSEPPALTLNFDFDWPSAAKPRAPLRLSNKVSLSLSPSQASSSPALRLR
jgi:hypothetical protein